MNNMPVKGMIAGFLLLLVAVGGYLGSGMASWTALIPAFVGVPIYLFSRIASNPDKLKMGMHVAAVLGLIGFLAAVGKLAMSLSKGGGATLTLFSLGAMALICGIFLFQCVQSFKEARRNK